MPSSFISSFDEMKPQENTFGFYNEKIQ